MPEEQDDEPLQAFEADEAPESINPLQAGLDEARADVAVIFDRIKVDPAVLKEVDYGIMNGVTVRNRPWLRDALLAELGKIERAQQMDYLRHFGEPVTLTECLRGYIRELLGWHLGDKKGNTPEPPENRKPYLLTYNPKFLKNVKGALTYLYHDFHDEITDSKPKSADGPNFTADMQKTVRYFYLLFGEMSAGKEAEKDIDVKRETLQAHRLLVLASMDAICEVLKNYTPEGARWGSPALYECQQVPWPIDMILESHKKFKEEQAEAEKLEAEALDTLNRAAGGPG